jgi:hypothetical protein
MVVLQTILLIEIFVFLGLIFYYSCYDIIYAIIHRKSKDNIKIKDGK